MSATDDDLEVNFAEIDRLKAEDKQKTAPAPQQSAPPARIEVESDPEPAKIEVVHAESDPEAPAAAILKPDDGIKKLQAQLDSEKQARIDADRRARQAAEAERLALTEVQSSRLDVIKDRIENATQNKAVYKAEYAAALAAQDFDKAAEIQSQMSDNAANLAILTRAKTDLEKAPPPQLRAPVDEVEAFCSRLTPTSAAWVRKHPEYVRDPELNAAMLDAHKITERRKIAADSPEYFRAIEASLGIEPAAESAPVVRRAPVDDDPTADAAQEVREPVRRAAPAAAPVSRSGNGTGARKTTIRLTAAQREAAEISGVSLEEYARGVAEVEQERKDGRLN